MVSSVSRIDHPSIQEQVRPGKFFSESEEVRAPNQPHSKNTPSKLGDDGAMSVVFHRVDSAVPTTGEKTGNILLLESLLRAPAIQHRAKTGTVYPRRAKGSNAAKLLECTLCVPLVMVAMQEAKPPIQACAHHDARVERVDPRQQKFSGC